jgi:hypothetical protein
MNEYKDFTFTNSNNDKVRLSVYVCYDEQKYFNPDTELEFDKDCCNGYNDLYITVDTRNITDSIIDKLIDVARREKPEFVEWLEMKKLNYELFRSF